MPDDTFDLQHLHLEVSGPEDGPPVLLVHGWGSSAELMRPIARALQDTYRVYNVDLPGHGHSPPPPTAWGVPEHAALLRTLIDTQVGAPVAVIGHSNGGRIALYMASDPDLARRLRQLVLVSPSGVRRQERSWTYHLRRTTARALKAPINLLPPGEIRAFMLDWLHHSLVWRMLGSSDYRQLEGVMRETFVKTVNYYLEDRLAHIDRPVLLFWGEHDDAVTRQQMAVLEETIPDAGLIVLNEAGHYGFLDDFDTFITATRYFLEHPVEDETTRERVEA